MIRLDLLRYPTFRAAVLGGSLFRIGTGAIPFLLPLMLQEGFGYSPFHSGIVTCASAAGAFGIESLAFPFTAFTLTACIILWVKSMEYHWFSTMYGVWFFAGCVRAALSLVVHRSIGDTVLVDSSDNRLGIDMLAFPNQHVFQHPFHPCGNFRLPLSLDRSDTFLCRDDALVSNLMQFHASNAGLLEELGRTLRITDGVMRHLAVNRVKGGQTKAPAPVAAVAAGGDDSDGPAE